MATASLRESPVALDTTVSLVTPERIAFRYPLAGPFRRLFAYLLDLLFQVGLAAVGLIASLVLALGTPSGFGPALAVYFAMIWGYGIFWEGLFNGQTPGKRLVGIRVVADRGVPISAAQAVVRNLVGAVDGLIPFCYLTGLTSMVLTRKFQRLGDLAAGTMVVVEEPYWRRAGVVRVDEPAVQDVLPWLPLRVSARGEMARALSDYAKARVRFHASLREEMAGPLANQIRRRYNIPAETTADAVVCALYHRVFLGE